MQLTEHRYDNKPPRFYVDGQRVGREEWNDIKDRAYRENTLCSIHTQSKYDANGNAHRINHSTVSENPQR